MSSGPEKKIGVWRRSVTSPGFWWRTLITVGLYPLILWRKNQITLTNKRVIQRRGGVLGGSEASINIENITDIFIDKSPMGAVLGYSTIRIQSAGSSAAEIAFEELGNASQLRDAIFDLSDGVADDAAKS